MSSEQIWWLTTSVVPGILTLLILWSPLHKAEDDGAVSAKAALSVMSFVPVGGWVTLVVMVIITLIQYRFSFEREE